MVYDTVTTIKNVFPDKKFEYFYPEIKYSSFYVHNKLLRDTQKYALYSLVSDDYETYKIINNYDYYVNSNYKEVFNYSAQFYKFKYLHLNVLTELYHIYSAINLKHYFDSGENILIQFPNSSTTYSEPKFLTLYLLSYIFNTSYVNNIDDIEDLSSNVIQIIVNNSDYIGTEISGKNFLLDYINQYQNFAKRYFTTDNLYKSFIQRLISFMKYYLVYHNYFYNDLLEIHSADFNNFITNTYKQIMSIYKEDIAYAQMNKYKFDEIIQQMKYFYTYLQNLINLNSVNYDLKINDLEFPTDYNEKLQTNFTLDNQHIKMVLKKTLAELLVNNLDSLFKFNTPISDFRQLFICTIKCIDNLVDDLLENIEISVNIDSQITESLFAYYMNIQKGDILKDIKNYIIYRLMYLN